MIIVSEQIGPGATSLILLANPMDDGLFSIFLPHPEFLYHIFLIFS